MHNEHILEGLNQGSVKRQIGSVDIAKFIGSFLILAMHSDVFRDNYYLDILLEIAARWGVPFFFISSSFFLFRKSRNGIIEKRYLLNYLFRIGMLYMCWGIFNLPSIYITRLYTKDLRDIDTWAEFIKNTILSSTFTGSWYLISCVFSACFIHILSKYFKTQRIMLITVPIYVICVMSSVYQGIFPTRISRILSFFCFPLNIFTGSFYFAIGKYIAENETILIRIMTKVRAVFFFLVFYLVYVLELLIAKHSGVYGSSDMAFSTVALSVALFLLCLQSNKTAKHCVLLRKISVIIYCCQGNVLLLNSLCNKMLGGGHTLIAFSTSVFVITAIVIAVLLIQKWKPGKCFDYLT